MASVRAVSAGVWNTTAGAKADTIAALPGDLLVAVTGHDGQTGSHAVTDNQGGTWVQVISALSSTSVDSVAVWIRTTRVELSATYTVTTTPASSTGGGLQVFAVAGMLRFGSAAVRSSGKQDNQTAATTPAPVLGLTPLATSLVVTGLIDGTNGTANQNPRASYTERFDNGHNAPATGFATSSRDSGETSSTLTFGGTTPSIYGVVAVELDATDPSISQPHPLVLGVNRPAAKFGPVILSFQESRAAPPGAAVVLGSTTDRSAPRSTTAANLTTTGTASSRTAPRSSSTATVITSASASSRSAPRASSTATVITTGIASSRTNPRVSAPGLPLVLGVASSRTRPQSLAAALPIALGIASSRTRPRSTSAANLTTTATASSRSAPRSTAVGLVLVLGGASSRTRPRSTSAGLPLVLGTASSRTAPRLLAAVLPIVVAVAGSRSRPRSSSATLVVIPGTSTSRTAPRLLGAGTVITGATVVQGSASTRSAPRSTSSASVFALAAASSRTAPRSSIVVSPFTTTGSTISRTHSRVLAVEGDAVVTAVLDISHSGRGPDTTSSGRGADVAGAGRGAEAGTAARGADLTSAGVTGDIG